MTFHVRVSHTRPATSHPTITLPGRETRSTHPSSNPSSVLTFLSIIGCTPLVRRRAYHGTRPPPLLQTARPRSRGTRSAPPLPHGSFSRRGNTHSRSGTRNAPESMPAAL